MQFTTAFIASAAALTASALPQTIGTPIPDGTRFGIIAIRSGSPIHNEPLQAAHKALLVGANAQNASCDSATNFATFYIIDEELFLHSTDAPYQSVFVDRSGMGQGVVGYQTGAEPIGARSETKGWTLAANNELKFDGAGIQACPGSIDGAWSIWLQGVSAPAGIENCLSIAGTALGTDSPISCIYSQE
jgi:hypothetical protein